MQQSVRQDSRRWFSLFSFIYWNQSINFWYVEICWGASLIRRQEKEVDISIVKAYWSASSRALACSLTDHQPQRWVTGEDGVEEFVGVTGLLCLIYRKLEFHLFAFKQINTRRTAAILPHSRIKLLCANFSTEGRKFGAVLMYVEEWQHCCEGWRAGVSHAVAGR